MILDANISAERGGTAEDQAISHYLVLGGSRLQSRLLYWLATVLK